MKLQLSKVAAYPAPARIGSFIFVLLLLWLPFALPIYLLVADRNLASILTLLILYSEFVWLVRFWGKRVYGQPDLLWRYGLEFSLLFGRELAIGLSIGISSLLFLFGLQAALGWITWGGTAALPHIILEGLLVALGIGFAEELLFRGWLLDELQRDYNAGMALWVDAVIFASLHGFRPQFPALVLLGATLVWAKRSCRDRRFTWRRDRLGLPIGLHAGLVWSYYIVNVGQLAQYSDRVPAWVTGIDRNPLAGAMGLLFLAILAFSFRQFARSEA